MYVADTKDLWREYAIANGIAHSETDAEGMMTLVYNEGFSADHIGSMVKTPAEWDNTTDPPTLIKEAVMDDRFHVNLRVVGEKVEDTFVKSKKYRPKSGKSGVAGVAWVDPSTVETPQRVWLGGMQYFAENIPDKPVNTEPPILSHTTAAVGNKVSVMTKGVWTGEIDQILYQWMRDGVKINQAITFTHTVNLQDVDCVLTCVETAKNAAGETSATSNECMVS
jgi:hypothetical protein